MGYRMMHEDYPDPAAARLCLERGPGLARRGGTGPSKQGAIMAAVTVAATNQQREVMDRLRIATEPLDLGRVREQRKERQARLWAERAILRGVAR